jgi:hypothetical protein
MVVTINEAAGTMILGGRTYPMRMTDEHYATSIRMPEGDVYRLFVHRTEGTAYHVLGGFTGRYRCDEQRA